MNPGHALDAADTVPLYQRSNYSDFFLNAQRVHFLSPFARFVVQYSGANWPLANGGGRAYKQKWRLLLRKGRPAFGLAEVHASTGPLFILTTRIFLDRVLKP